MHTDHATRIKEDLTLLDQELSETLKHTRDVTGGAVNVSLTMLHHPALARRYEPFGIGFITDGVLPARDRELIILRTSRICHSPYEWAHHTRIGLACGVTEEEIHRITQDDLSEWDSPDAELLAAVDSVTHNHTLTEWQWSGLSERYDTTGAIEIVMLAGHYAMLAGLLNSAGTQVEPGVKVPVPLG